ncbi:hypothetical protein BK128_09565 [Viridibacillus sp. FSL H7-0596]|uniref:hypothetical protein n=1 Tax=Viridibacillus sp. FSL H7-0596 TaxID=1928923 RepID=UPI00096E3B3E|nr:hypothetical protein [Viridibacillus sp. FSL H7-0596]OMC86903.1 hypothetical protein BK128_09565 [Viridibacillus sp. FSL H7-0596]
MKRIDKTYSELWNMYHDSKNALDRETAKMAIDALHLREEEILKERRENDRLRKALMFYANRGLTNEHEKKRYFSRQSCSES